MTQPTKSKITYKKGRDYFPLSEESFHNLIRNGDPKNRNFRVFQVNRQKKQCLILDRCYGLETRYNPKYGYLIYQFMIGRGNKFLHGKMFFPGDKRKSLQVIADNIETIETMRFGRSYHNQTIIVEYY